MKTFTRYLAILATAAVLAGCATTTSLDAEVVGQCMQTQVDTHWTNPPLAKDFSSRRLLLVEKYQPTWIHRDYQFLDVIPVGTKLKIYDIERWDRPTESYLRVKARFLEGPYADEVFDLSACAPAHLRPMFIVACTMDARQIRFNPEYLKPCAAE